MPSRISVDRDWTAVDETAHGLTQNAATTFAVQSVGSGSVETHIGTSTPDGEDVHFIVVPGQIVPLRFDPSNANLYVRTQSYSPQALTIEVWPVT